MFVFMRLCMCHGMHHTDTQGVCMYTRPHALMLVCYQALAAALENNCTLAVLNLKANYISDDGAIALAKVARRSKSLRALITTSNDIEHAGDKALEDAIYENDKLVDYLPVEVMCRF